MGSAKGAKKDMRRQNTGKPGRLKKVAIEDESTKNEELVNKVLPEEFVKELVTLTDVKEIESKLCGHFELADIHLDLKNGMVLDVYTGAVWWALQQKFSADQVSGFFTIVHTLLDNVKEKSLNLVDNMIECKKMVVSSQTKPELFTVAECKAVTDYLNMSLMKHYKLFEFMFGVAQAEEIIGADLSIEVLPPMETPYPAPLCEAVHLEMYEDYAKFYNTYSMRHNYLSIEVLPPMETPYPAPLCEAVHLEMYEEYIATPPPSPELEEEVEEEEKLEESLIESNVLNELTIEEIKMIFEEVSTRLLANVTSNIRDKIKLREADYIARINKIHQVVP